MRKEKKEFYGYLNTSILTENRTFWKTVKPFLAEKSKKVSKITLTRLITRLSHRVNKLQKYLMNIL